IRYFHVTGVQTCALPISYRDAWTRAGHPAEAADIAVAVHGFVAEDDRHAKTTYLDHERAMFTTGSADIGRPMAPPAGREASYEEIGRASCRELSLIQCVA